MSNVKRGQKEGCLIVLVFCSQFANEICSTALGSPKAVFVIVAIDGAVWEGGNVSLRRPSRAKRSIGSTFFFWLSRVSFGTFFVTGQLSWYSRSENHLLPGRPNSGFRALLTCFFLFYSVKFSFAKCPTTHFCIKHRAWRNRFFLSWNVNRPQHKSLLLHPSLCIPLLWFVPCVVVRKKLGVQR